jgi:hypothetical protein
MRDGNRRGRLARLVAVLIVGILAGSVMLTPVGAHISSFKHLTTKHFFTKKAADARFINVGEAAASATNATSAANATNAANADKLDALDSTAFQRSGCVNGNVLGYARIAQAAYGATYGNVPVSFSCVSGFTVRAKQATTGVFTIDLGFNRTSALCGEHVAIATLEQEGEIRAHTSSDGSDCVVIVETFDADGLAFGVDFNVAVMRAA